MKKIQLLILSTIIISSQVFAKNPLKKLYTNEISFQEMQERFQQKLGKHISVEAVTLKEAIDRAKIKKHHVIFFNESPYTIKIALIAEQAPSQTLIGGQTIKPGACTSVAYNAPGYRIITIGEKVPPLNINPKVTNYQRHKVKIIKNNKTKKEPASGVIVAVRLGRMALGLGYEYAYYSDALLKENSQAASEK